MPDTCLDKALNILAGGTTINTTIKLALGTILGLALASMAHAQDFPERPISLLVAFNAGGGTDLLIRGFAAEDATAIGADLFVSNMTGGSGTVAAATLEGQKPTGDQLGYLSVTVATIQPYIKDVPCGVDSWEPICSVAAAPTVVFTNASDDLTGLDTMKAALRAEPGAMTHLTTAVAFQGLGLMAKIKHRSFQGSGPALQAMAANTIRLFGDTEILMQRGDFRPLSAFSDERLENFPDLPIATEVGIEAPLNQLSLWGGLLAPAGADPAVVAKLCEACGAAVNSEGFPKFATDTQTTIKYRNTAEFNTFFRAQSVANAAITEAAGL